MTATLTKPAKVKLPHIEQLAAKLADAREQRKIWEAAEAALVEQLVEAHTAGVAPTKFAAAGWAFSFQEGRQTVQYPESLTAQVRDMQAAAVAAGVTTVKIGKPFWKVTAVKEAG